MSYLTLRLYISSDFLKILMGPVVKIFAFLSGFVFVLLPGLLFVSVLYFMLCWKTVFPTTTPPEPSRKAKIHRICSKIAAHVDAHPNANALTLAQLQATSAITHVDISIVQFMEFYPITAASSDEAVLFQHPTRPGRDYTYRWHKSRGRQRWGFRITQDNNFTIWYPYPDSSVADWPRWTRYLIDNRTNETVYSYETKRRHTRARWTPDGSMLAVIEENPDGDKELIVIFPAMQPVKEVRLPDDISLIDFLPKEYRSQINEFEREQITYFTWKYDRKMSIDWIAHAARRKNGRRIGRWTIKSDVDIQFDQAGNVKLIEPETITVSESRD